MFGEEGLTLIEIMVAMMIFMVVATGVAGSLITGLRATASGRQSTFGKETAQKRIEEMRSRTFYVPYSSDPNVGTTADYDLLDVYYPNLGTSAYQNWTGAYYPGADAHFTMVSPPDIHGIITTVETRFVDVNRNVVVPPGSYNSNSPTNDIPPSNLVDVIVTTSWSDRSDLNSYSLESLISSTGQTPPVSENGCEHSSNTRVDVQGIVISASLGTADPYTLMLQGTFGDAHASAVYSCNSNLLASATGGKLSVVAGLTSTGATASVSGPPEIERIIGPINLQQPDIWPSLSILNSRVKAQVGGDQSGMEVEAEGEANVGTQSLSLEEVSGIPLDLISGYKRWDFINPTVTVTGSNSGDDGEDIEAEIEQQNGETEGKTEIGYQLVNILPLQQWPLLTTTNPSAAQGLIFIRDFHANAHAKANAQPGGQTTTMDYEFTLGMFNPLKSGCDYQSTGDTCYDMYSITPETPLQNVSLGNPGYRLQNELLTEWYSYTNNDITHAMDVSADGKTATITADALVKISGRFGDEIRWNNNDNSISLVNQKGIQKVWFGAIDITVEQDG